MSILVAENVSYVYGEGTPFRKETVAGVSFEIQKGEIVGIIGHTGSGKSTLVQMLSGLLKPESGRILVDGEDIFADPEKDAPVPVPGGDGVPVSGVSAL